MKTTKITESELAAKGVTSLPTRPNAPTAFGGTGLTAAELKAAFDALPTLIAERLNLLIDDITAEHGASITSSIKTGIAPSHTLKELLDDIMGGAFITYLRAPDGSVGEYLLSLREDVNKLANALGIEL